MMDWLGKALQLPEEFLSGGKGGGVIQVIEVFVNNINLTFLYKIGIECFKKFQQKIKLPPVGIELTTDHHWFRSLMLVQLC